MLYAQLGQKFGSDKLFATLAGTYYNFNKIVAGTSGGLKGGNIGTFSAGTNTDTRFDAIAIDAELSSRSEEHTYELQSLMRISYAVFCLKKKIENNSESIRMYDIGETTVY